MRKQLPRLILAGALLLAAPILLAQTPTLSLNADQAFVEAGANVGLALTLSTATPISALQFELVGSAGQIFIWHTPLASKEIRCEGSRCLIVGNNQTVIPPGVVAIATYKITEDTSFTLSNTFSVKPDGTASVLLAGQVVRVAVLSPYDLDKDGKLTVADFDLSIGRALADAALAYTVVDVQLVANAIAAAQG